MRRLSGTTERGCPERGPLASRDPQPDARTAIAAYGPYEEDVLEQALPVYASWVAASFMVAVARRPDAAPALERQLQFLRRFRSAGTPLG